MNKALAAAENLREFLNGIKKNPLLSKSKLASLEADDNYLEKCISVLSGSDPRAINELWTEVQFLSQFFGGDYAQGESQLHLMTLMDDFHAAVLQLVTSLRS